MDITFSKLYTHALMERRKECHDELVESERIELEKKYRIKKEKANRHRLFLNEYYPPTFGGYLHVISTYKHTALVKKLFVPSIILGFIIGVIFGLVDFVGLGGSSGDTFNEIMQSTLTGTIGVPLSVSFLLYVFRPLFGYTYGVVLGFIGYPIFAGICKSMYKKQINENRKIADKISSEIASADKEYESLELKDYEEDKKEAEKLLEIYKEHQNTSVLASWATEIILNRIENTDRNSRNEKISCVNTFALFDSQIISLKSSKERVDSVICFEDERIEKLPSIIAEVAFAKAFSDKIQAIIEKRKPELLKSKLIEPHFTLEVQYSSLGVDKESKKDFMFVEINYSANNPNYKVKSSW